MVRHFDVDLRATLARLMESGQPVTAIRLILESTGCGLHDAKACFEHLVIVPQRCHSCSQVIPNAEYLDCTNCGALNIGIVPSCSEQ